MVKGLKPTASMPAGDPGRQIAFAAAPGADRER